jgi:hypothetical protein
MRPAPPPAARAGAPGRAPAPERGKRHVGHEAARAEREHALREQFDVLEQVRREEHQPPRVGRGELAHHRQQLGPHQRVESRRRLVEQQVGRPVRLGGDEGELHPHAARQRPEPRVRGERQALPQLLGVRRVPRGEQPREQGEVLAHGALREAERRSGR